MTTVPIWVPIIVAVISIVAAWGAQVIVSVFANRREREGRTHERELKQMDVESQLQQQLRQERIEAYIKLVHITAAISPHVGDADGAIHASQERLVNASSVDLNMLAEAVSEVELVGGSNKVKDMATKLREKHRLLAQEVKSIRAGGRDPSGSDSVVATYSEVVNLRSSFVEAARSDTGHHLN